MLAIVTFIRFRAVVVRSFGNVSSKPLSERDRPLGRSNSKSDAGSDLQSKIEAERCGTGPPTVLRKVRSVVRSRPASVEKELHSRVHRPRMPAPDGEANRSRPQVGRFRVLAGVTQIP